MVNYESKLFRGRSRAPALTEDVLDTAICNLYGLLQFKLKQESRSKRKKHRRK